MLFKYVFSIGKKCRSSTILKIVREINVQETIPVFVFEVLLLLPAVVLFKHEDVVETK